MTGPRAPVAERGAVAILGTRGVPARYSGFETFAEQLGTRLAARGWRVTVYRRSRYAGFGEVDSINSVTLPALYTKYLETVSHSFLSTLHCARTAPDVALVCNTVNAGLLPLLSAAGVATVLNVDGIEWQRRKWSVLGRGMHWLSEHLAVRLADGIVADSRTVQRYYREQHGATTTFIAYGSELPRPASASALTRHGLVPGGYDLSVCRFEPENNPLAVVRAHARGDIRFPLVMVGGAPYAATYVRRVREAADASTLFLGPVFGEPYRQLLFNARAVLYAGEVGGTHPVLLEAMGAGRAIIYNGTPENLETVGPAGLAYAAGDEDDLTAVWRAFHRDPDPALGQAAAQRARTIYRWDAVATDYERLFARLRTR